MTDGGTPPPPGRPARPPRRWPEGSRPGDDLSERLNRQWRLFGDQPGPTLRHRLAEPLRMALAFVLGPQRAFNSLVVQHINHIHERTSLIVDDLFHRTDLLFDAIERLEDRISEMDGLVDDAHRHQQAFAASERRVADSVGAMREEHAQMRTALGVLRHEVQQLARTAQAPAAPAVDARTAPASGSGGVDARPPATVAAAQAPPAHALSHKYVGFEDEFRGSAEEVRAGLSAYVALFAGADDVLDIGCGRGEFLALLRDAGISARGIDLNETMVEVCRERGLDATAADALAYLAALPDGSLGGLFAAQVVEHLQPAYLTQLLDMACAKLRPGGVIALETINPACWFAFFSSYIRDITHERPLHPDTLKYLLVATGFERVEIRYSAPYPAHDKLQAVAGLPADAANTLNGNVEKLNQLLFTYLDYAAVGRKPA